MRVAALCSVVYAGLIGLTGLQFARAPTGFIPEQDQGYLDHRPAAAARRLARRTEAVVRKATEIILRDARHRACRAVRRARRRHLHHAPNAGTIFSGLPPLYNHERRQGPHAPTTILADLRKRLAEIQDAFIITIPPPPVQRHRHCRRLQDDGAGPARAAARRRSKRRRRTLVDRRQPDPGLVGVFSLFNTRTPKVYADIDRVKAEKLGRPGQPTCSRRCRSISARPMSTTSTIWAAPTR